MTPAGGGANNTGSRGVSLLCMTFSRYVTLHLFNNTSDAS